MGRIRGHFEWDDDGLTPGRKREGGLHQNLYDSAGNLKGNARFIPDTGADREPLVVTETVYVHIEERRQARQDDELQDAIGALIRLAILYGVVRARPHAERWWQQTAKPALHARREQLRGRRPRRKSKASVVDATVTDSPQRALAAAADADRSDMSSAEAQARYLAALAARAFSDEQLELVISANIVDGTGTEHGIEQVEAALAALPHDQVTALVRSMVMNPTMLGEDTLAELASLLATRPIESDPDQPGRRH